jgi:large subunit ribosomal protein L1
MAHTRGKKYRNTVEVLDRKLQYDYKAALELLKTASYTKFDQTVDIAIVTGLDVRHADQQIRGAISLPAGTGKNVRVLVFAGGDKIAEAEQAGADIVGGEELGEKVKNGFMDFEVVLATPDMMKVVGGLGRILGPRGLMPNPKTGTVTNDIARTVGEYKSGKVNYRAESGGVVHALIGKVSFKVDDLASNFETFYNAIVRAKPAGAKGVYIKKVFVSSTMGPGLRIDMKTIPAEHGN